MYLRNNVLMYKTQYKPSISINHQPSLPTITSFAVNSTAESIRSSFLQSSLKSSQSQHNQLTNNWTEAGQHTMDSIQSTHQPPKGIWIPPQKSLSNSTYMIHMTPQKHHKKETWKTNQVTSKQKTKTSKKHTSSSQQQHFLAVPTTVTWQSTTSPSTSTSQ